LAPPETRVEYLHGIEMFAKPAQEPHAVQHFDLTYVLGAHLAKGYRGAIDMLTRTGHTSDFAPDASVFNAERDRQSGGRKLEEIAFEVCSEQPIGVPTDKARELANRGVRRIFCIIVKHKRVLEWDKELDSWRTMLDEGQIEDRCFAKALPIQAIVDATAADNAVAAALLSRDVEAVRRIREEGEVLGMQRGEALGMQKAQGMIRRAAEAMLVAGMSPEKVAEVLSLSIEEVEGMRGK